MLVQFVKSNASSSYSPNGSYRSKKLGYEKLWWSTYQITMVIFTRYPSKLSGYQMSVVHLTVRNKTVFIQSKMDAVMKKFDPTQLSYFTGTEKYYRISRRHLLTDGTK